MFCSRCLVLGPARTSSGLSVAGNSAATSRARHRQWNAVRRKSAPPQAAEDTESGTQPAAKVQSARDATEGEIGIEEKQIMTVIGLTTAGGDVGALKFELRRSRTLILGTQREPETE